MKAYEYLAKMLHDYGTTHFFFQEVVLRMTAKEAEAKYGIQGIMAHSEVAAGYMADGYARASGKVGVCAAQSIGAANLAAGLADAWLGTTPVIAITGKKSPQYQYRHAYQEMDHTKLYEAATKFQADAVEAEQLPRLLRACYKEASTGKPRPVHLDVRGLTGFEGEQAELSEPYMAEPEYGFAPAQRMLADPAKVQQAAARLAEAQKPILVIGRGAYMSGAGAEILQLMESCNIPAVTTPDGKTVIDEKHPLWAGIVGNYGMSCANKAVAGADLVIFIGTQTADQTTLDWNVPKPTTKAIQIDIHPGELGKNYPDCVGLAGDAKSVCGQLAAAATPAKHPEWAKTVQGYFADIDAMQRKRMASDDGPILTERLCGDLAAVLPDNAVLVSDTGYSAIWTATYMRMKPGQRYMRAAGSLGWSFPAALGAKCGTPDRPVVCFTGDGGFYYYLGEMETAMRHGINTVTVVNNNYALGQERLLYDRVYADNPALGRKMVAFKPVSFAKIASEFGLHAVAVSHANDIGPAIRESLQANRPALVEVFTNPDTAGPLPTL